MTGSPIRVLQYIPVLKIGGTERHVANLVAGLDRARIDVRVSCHRTAGEFLGGIEALGIPVTEYPIRSLYGVHTAGQQLRLARDLRRHRIQIVHSYNFYGNCFAIPAARLARTPVVVASIRDTGAFLTLRQQRANRLVCRLADVVLVNADAVREWLVAQGYDSGKIVVIRNGIDVARFDGTRTGGGIRRELGLSPSAPVIAVVGRINQLKGIEYFLEAAAVIAGQRPDAHFLVVGPYVLNDDAAVERYRRELQAHVARLGLEQRVTFTGPRIDVPEILADVTVSVHPSLSEGLPNTVLESMAAATPVVATDVGGTREAIEHGRSGLLVPPADAAALTRSIRELMSQPEAAARMGCAARRRVEEHFSLTSMVRQTEDLYAQLAGGTTPRPAPRAVRIRRQVKAVGAALLAAAGGDRLLGRLQGSPGRLLVLGYHRVVENFDESARSSIPPMLVSTAMLEAQLDWAGRRYRFVSLDELQARLASGAPIERPLAAVTFDDGYADVYEHAVPLLARKGIPSAMFVVSDLVGTERLQIYDELYLLMARALRAPGFRAAEFLRAVAARGVRVPAEGVAVFDDAFTAMRAFFTTLSQSAIAEVIDVLRGYAGVGAGDLASLRALSWEEMAAMHRGGIAIGSHTRRHVILPAESPAVVDDELAVSRARLEAALGAPVRHFAYPDGQFTPAVVRAVARAGYSMAVTTCRHRDAEHPLLTVPRRLLWEHSTVDATQRFSPTILRCYASGAFDFWQRCTPHGTRPAPVAELVPSPL